jgi:superfamily I DNA and/or RNA helicase
LFYHRDSNDFSGQLSLSLFAGLRFAGFLTAMFEEQRRMHPLISALVSEISYNRALRDSPLVKVEARATTIVRSLNKEMCSIEKPLLLLNVSQSRDKAGPQNSRENLINVAVVMTHIERLILHCSLTPGEIVVLVPYRVQYLRYLSAMTLFHEEHRQIDVRAFLVRTIDSFQGNERPVTFFFFFFFFVFWDLTVTDRIGFVGDGIRLNAVLSRATCQLRRRLCLEEQSTSNSEFLERRMPATSSGLRTT